MSSTRRADGETTFQPKESVDDTQGSLRRECLDHIIILGERHLSTVLAEFVAYYNHDRPHRTLGLETPVSNVRSLSGEVRSRPILGGLHHAYERAT